MGHASPKRRVAALAHGAKRRARARAATRLDVCDRVDEWSRSRGGPEPVELHAACTVTRRPPRTVEAAIDTAYTSRLVAQQRGRYLVRVPGARLVGTSGLVVLPDGSIAAESVYGRAQLEHPRAVADSQRPPTATRAGDHFSLVVNWSAGGNYYHWFHDTLTRLHGAMDVLPPDTTFVAPAGIRGFQDEALRAVGVDPRRVSYLGDDEVWELETLQFAPPVTNSGSDLRAADVFVRDRILSHYGLVADRRDRRVLLSRQHAPARRVVNHAEVEQALAPYGFETCVAEHLTVQEQAELFSRAEVVVSAHGAGFTNMLFAPPGLAVIDMIDRSRIKPAYIFWAMAEELGHDYWYLLTDTVARPGWHQGDTVVPIDKLLETLRCLGLRPGSCGRARMGESRSFRRRERGAADHGAADRAVCDDLAGWAASWPGAERVVVAPPFTVTRALPRTTQPVVDPSFMPLCSVPVPEQALVKIPRALVRTGSRGQHVGIFMLPDGQVVGETVALTPDGRRLMLRDLPAYREPLPDRPTRMPGSYFALVGFGAHHYYHWCHDLVMGACDVAHRLPAGTTLVVPSGLRPFQAETLALLGLDRLDRVEIPMDACWELEHLYVVTPRLKTQIDHAEPFTWFRDAVMDRFGLAAGAPTRRLHVSRRDDNHWRTTNEEAVEAVLASAGFETVLPARLPLREQAALFCDAATIVGTGAGLFNMVFAPTGARVLQLQEPSHIVHALWTEAEALGHEYHYLLGDAVPNPQADDADIHVPLDDLHESLRALAGD